MSKNAAIACTLCLLMGCSNSGGKVIEADVIDGGGADQKPLERVIDAVWPTANDTLVGIDDGWSLDAPLDLFQDAGFGCSPGEGCFGDPCAQHDDCLSGWCVEHLGQKVCTIACQDECPSGWSCQQVAGTAPDLVFVCVSDMANLCRPCNTTGDCQSAVGTKDVCVGYGDQGSFCGGSCQEDDDCPFGFACTDALSVDGIDTRQCVATTGSCPCTPSSVALALWTTCLVSNESGTCQGKRICTEAGLTDCDAATPMVETCNGLDDDCDGAVDEETCQDDNACTADSCSGEEGCINIPLDQGECMDGDACTVGDHCEDGQCVGTPVACDDSNPCTDDSCDGLGGCHFQPNVADCDDNDPCTVADECEAGACGGTAIACDCQVDADCAALEDGDLCNGTLFCDQTALPYQCAVIPDSQITCPEPQGTDAPCLATLCDGNTGNCQFVAANDGKPCEDGDLCTLADTCDGGTCVGQEPRNCNDGNPCTDDACVPDEGCLHTANQAPCFDGNLCTGGDVCKEGTCQPGALLVCDDGNPCTTDSCQDDSGCLFVAADGPCNDHNDCTGPDFCQAGTCSPGPMVDCDDENPCTDDACDAQTGCIHKLNALPCDDGDLCTTGDKCQLGECAGSGELPCFDGNGCTNDGCDPITGCQFVANSADCDDGNPCTLGDHCSAGTCKASKTLVCNDDNVCTADSCDPAAGCLYLPVSGSCEDGDICTVSDTCQNGECSPGIALNCDDQDACTQDVCGPEGCLHLPLSVGDCDDQDPCTTVDSCVAGLCVGSGEASCFDDNVCTQDLCVAGVGCAFPPEDGVACDDGNACTVTDLCVAGECLGSGAPDCDDANACTMDSCVPPAGCENQAIIPCCGDHQVHPPEACDDGNLNNGDGCDASCQEETAVTMEWVDPQSGSCTGTMWQTMQQIVAAMPAGPINVTIEAKQLSPKPGYGEWSATFEQTDCVRKWLQAIADKNISTYNHWDPAVCKATSTQGDPFFFVCKSDGGAGRQIAIYPVGVSAATYMKIYMLDRTGAWCDLAGVNNRPGFDQQVTNNNSSGTAGDYLRFTWSF